MIWDLVLFLGLVCMMSFAPMARSSFQTLGDAFGAALIVWLIFGLFIVLPLHWLAGMPLLLGPLAVFFAATVVGFRAAGLLFKARMIVNGALMLRRVRRGVGSKSDLAICESMRLRDEALAERSAQSRNHQGAP